LDAFANTQVKRCHVILRFSLSTKRFDVITEIYFNVMVLRDSFYSVLGMMIYC
jgi:hypothetical protein